MEIIITALIIVLSVFILYRSIKKKSAGKCDCGSCSSSCPKYENEHKK